MSIERVEKRSWFSRPIIKELNSGYKERLHGPSVFSRLRRHPIKTDLEVISPDEVVAETAHVGRDSLFNKNSTCPDYKKEVLKKHGINEKGDLSSTRFIRSPISALIGRRIKFSWKPTA